MNYFKFLVETSLFYFFQPSTNESFLNFVNFIQNLEKLRNENPKIDNEKILIEINKEKNLFSDISQQLIKYWEFFLIIFKDNFREKIGKKYFIEETIIFKEIIEKNKFLMFIFSQNFIILDSILKRIISIKILMILKNFSVLLI